MFNTTDIKATANDYPGAAAELLKNRKGTWFLFNLPKSGSTPGIKQVIHTSLITHFSQSQIFTIDERVYSIEEDTFENLKKTLESIEGLVDATQPNSDK